MTVASDYAAYLKAPSLYVSARTADAASWPDGATIERSSPLATAPGAYAEAGRQAAFLGGSTVRDVAIVPGKRAYLFGRAIVGRIGRLGYDGGAPAFVIGVEERGDGTTVLTLLRKLA